MRFILAITLCLAIAVPAAAQVRYKDSEGITHWVDSLDQVPKEYRTSVVGAPPTGPARDPVSPMVTLSPTCQRQLDMANVGRRHDQDAWQKYGRQQDEYGLLLGQMTEPCKQELTREASRVSGQVDWDQRARESKRQAEQDRLASERAVAARAGDDARRRADQDQVNAQQAALAASIDAQRQADAALKTATDVCLSRVRYHTLSPRLDAFVPAPGYVELRGTQNERYLFDKCLAEELAK